MKELQNGKEKIQKICDILKSETLEPAKQEASEIVENAHMQAKEILANAREDAQKIIDEAYVKNQEKKRSFESSLHLASRQVIEELKQKIEKKLFDENLRILIVEETKKPEVIRDLIKVVIKGIEEEGLDIDLSAYIAKNVNARQINEMLSERVLNILRKGKVVIGDFEGGVKIKMHDSQITIDISDEALFGLIGNYIRRDFRDLIFQEK